MIVRMGAQRARTSTLRIAAPALLAIGLVTAYVTLRSPVPTYPLPSADDVQAEPREQIAPVPDEEPAVGTASGPTDAVIDAVPAATPVATVATPAANTIVVEDDHGFRPVQAPTSIHDVDFGNVSYPVGRSRHVSLVDGFYAEGEVGTDDFFAVAASEPIYGDLDGDGVDEAAIEVRTRRGTNGITTSVVWVLTADAARIVGLAETPARSTLGEPAMVRIEGGVLSVTSIEASGTPTRVTSNYRYTSELSRIDTRPPITWKQVGVDERGGVVDHSLVFRPETTRAVVAVDRSASNQRFRFDALGGQVVRSNTLEGAGVSLRIYDEATRLLVGEIGSAGRSDVTLRSDGGYFADVVFGADATDRAEIELAIADLRVLEAPTWEPRAHWASRESGDERLAWPQFTSVASPFDVDALNQSIVDFVEARSAIGRERLGRCDADAPTNYRLTYVPTLVSYDLVSVRFSELVSGCEQANSFQYLGVTADLNTGRVLDVRDLAIGQNSSVLEAAWWEHVSGPERSYPLGRDADDAPVELVGFAITTDGLWVDAHPDGPGADTSWPTFLAFDQLDGVVADSLVIRAASGRASTPPVAGCNC